MNDFKIISIFGGSASGKSSIAKELETKYPNSFSRVPADRLILSRIENDTQYFLRPINYDWDRFNLLLKDKKVGDRIYLPLFDYDSFKKVADTSDKSFIITKFLLIDSIAPYPDSEMFFYVNAPSELRKARMLKRDSMQNTNIIKHWDWSIISEEYYQRQFHKISVTLDGTRSINELAESVANSISNNFTNQPNL